jgi:hypothetical protein
MSDQQVVHYYLLGLAVSMAAVFIIVAYEMFTGED